MTKKRSTLEEKELRIEKAADLLAAGIPGRSVVKKLTDKYNVSPQTAREYVREAKRLVVESVDPADRSYIYSKVMSCIEQDRLDAQQQNNVNAQVGASKLMVKMLDLAPDDRMEEEMAAHFQDFLEERLGPRKGKIPTEKISGFKRNFKINNLDSMDYDRETNTDQNETELPF